MKVLQYLINHPEAFYMVWIVVAIDTITGIVNAVLSRRFQWVLLDTWIRKTVKYSGMLLFANLMEYYTQLAGVNLNNMGVIAIAGTIIIKEAGSIQGNFKNLWPDEPKEQL